MFRYLLILLLLAALVPFVPGLVGHGTEEEAGPETASSAQTGRTAGGTLKLRAERNGHFIAGTRINGKALKMMVDTGATFVALPASEARRAGIKPQEQDFTARISTANGIIAAAPVKIDTLELGPLYLRNVDAVVIPDASLSTPLLGMSALRRFKRFDISGDTMLLVQ
ncbi:retropepsin-like aspartic protease family protein [Pannonibacter phragmitetus]|uniref:retropepsin-like aspartic protease family protein n=1 Tax=Pannonibacter phragmitetus TaxID=121719 RepID=UPI003D2F382B